jgi:hypothetical protein
MKNIDSIMPPWPRCLATWLTNPPRVKSEMCPMVLCCLKLPYWGGVWGSVEGNLGLWSVLTQPPDVQSIRARFCPNHFNA